MTIGVPVRSMIYSGLRGVGKTVLINRLEEIADDYGIFHNHIEIEKKNDFISQIAECAQDFLREVSTKENLKI